MQNTMINEMVEKLTGEQNNINTQLAELDATYKTKRSEITAQLGLISAMLKAATGAPATTVVSNGSGAKRGGMSEQGRENIRKALAARRERLAAVNGVAPATPAVEAPAASEKQTEAIENGSDKKTAAKKGAK